MTPRFLAIVAAGLLAAAPTVGVAQSRMSLSLAGGLAAATGDLGNAVDLGFNAAAGVNLGGTRLPVGLRFEGAYNGFGYKNDIPGDVRIISGTANAVFNLSQTPDSPYLIAGLGAYNRRLSGGSTFRASDSKTATGINVGGGLRFPLSGLSTFFEARYHRMLGNSNEGANYQFIPITFGIMF